MKPESLLSKQKKTLSFFFWNVTRLSWIVFSKCFLKIVIRCAISIFYLFWVVYITIQSLCVLLKSLQKWEWINMTGMNTCQLTWNLRNEVFLLEKKKVTMQNILALSIIRLSLNWHFRRLLILGIFKVIFRVMEHLSGTQIEKIN